MWQPHESSLVTFDEDHNLRIFDAEKFKQSQLLHKKSVEFTDKIGQFEDLMKDVMSVLKVKGERIENEKLKAIGLRNRVKGEEEIRRSNVRDYQTLISEKHIELERHAAELESLSKIEQEQKKMIESLSSSEPPESHN
ncbi:intraflagellar transport protein 20 [Acrasis kona]|uniref:Intraflagellar transport protein 20 n=1 Tax=Acrasis kona TaxID=1008807 RepID=A0AAW2YVX0_9EUKA